jgi:hypothetical protein
VELSKRKDRHASGIVIPTHRVSGLTGYARTILLMGRDGKKTPATGEVSFLANFYRTNPELSIAMSLPGVEFFY